jgi:hypothetical protein
VTVIRGLLARRHLNSAVDELTQAIGLFGISKS